MAKRWHYMGDINLEHGGYFWREDGADDYVLCVRVSPCSDAGGPNNQFWIEKGSIYMPPDDLEKRRRCLSVLGEEDNPNPSRGLLVDAYLAYGHFDIDRTTAIQIGAKPDPAGRGWGGTTIDVQLRGNATLENYVRKQLRT